MKLQSHKILIRESHINLFTWVLVINGLHDKRVKEWCGQYLRESLAFISLGEGKWASNFADWNELGTRVLRSIGNDRIHPSQLMKESLILGRKLTAVFNKFEKLDKKSISLPTLKKISASVISLIHDITWRGAIPVFSDFEHFSLSHKLSAIVTKKVHDHHLPLTVQEYVSTLSSSPFESFSHEEKYSLFRLALKIKKRIKGQRISYAQIEKLILRDAILKNELALHVKKYAWINYAYQGPAWEEKDFLHTLVEMLQKHPHLRKAYQATQDESFKLHRKQREYEKVLHLTPEEKVYFDAARRFLFLKSYRIELRHRTNSFFDTLFFLLSKRYPPYSLTHFRYATPAEFLSFLRQPKFYFDVRERQKHCLYVFEQGKGRVVAGKRAESLFKTYILPEKIHKNIQEIHGQVACTGNARGKARVVNDRADIPKVSAGDILISISTVPDLLPAMKKAAAFVTDTGGITSHAAIVAREMHKPCIIGTKIATQVISDGDMVEVDAVKGVVKILKVS